MPELANKTELNYQAATKWGIPVGILYRLITLESSWNPRAVSPSGVHFGLGQLGPAVRNKYGVKKPFDPVENINAAAQYLREEYDHFGSWELAVSAYHAGRPAVEKAGGVPGTKDKWTKLPTADYVKRIVGTDGGIAGQVAPDAQRVVGPQLNLSSLKENPKFRAGLILGTASILVFFALTKMK